MIDIHAHILPGIDDGAEDLFDSLEMARVAVESGVTEIIVTPHCNVPGMFENYFNTKYIKAFRSVEKAIAEEGIPLRIYPGMEVFVTAELPQLIREGKILTLNGSYYMLFEFAFDEDTEFANEMLQQVCKLGVRPIIAHPERYRFIQQNLELAYEWCKKGYLLQCNKGSFMGRFGERCIIAANELLRHNLVSVIASDAHSPFRRTTYIRDAYEILLEEYDTSYLDILFEENPRRICKNEPVVRFEMKPFDSVER